MKHARTIGGDSDPKEKSCAYCSAKIGVSELFSYLFHPQSGTVFCNSCQSVNDLYPSENKPFVVTRTIISWVLGGLIAGPAIIYLGYIIYLAFFTSASIITSGLLIMVVISAGVFVGRYVNHFLSWFGGRLARVEDLPMLQFVSDKTTSVNE